MRAEGVFATRAVTFLFVRVGVRAGGTCGGGFRARVWVGLVSPGLQNGDRIRFCASRDGFSALQKVRMWQESALCVADGVRARALPAKRNVFYCLDNVFIIRRRASARRLKVRCVFVDAQKRILSLPRAPACTRRSTDAQSRFLTQVDVLPAMTFRVEWCFGMQFGALGDLLGRDGCRKRPFGFESTGRHEKARRRRPGLRTKMAGVEGFEPP